MLRRYPPVFGPGGGWYPIVHLIFWFAVLAGLIALAIFLVRRVEHGHGPHTHAGPPIPRPADAALEQVRSRYARGEITRDEYVQLMQDLGGTTPIPPPPPAG